MSTHGRGKINTGEPGGDVSDDAMRLGLVHTMPPLGQVFHELVIHEAAERRYPVEPIHVTDPWLLRTAMSSGVTPEVVSRLRSHVEHLLRQGAAGVLVTCSSLGEATEEVAKLLEADRPIVRVDQAMADHAVAIAGDGGRVAVLATVASTVGPTTRLIERSAEQAGVKVAVEVDVLTEAGRAREAGDNDRHDVLVAAAVTRWAGQNHAEVVVLAQASMARAASEAAVGADVPVLSSPALAARKLITVTGGR